MCFVILTFLRGSFLQLLKSRIVKLSLRRRDAVTPLTPKKVQVQIWIVQANCMEAGMSKDVMWTSCGQNRYKSWSPSSFFKLQTSMGINQVPRSYLVWESTQVLKWSKLFQKYTVNSITSVSLILFKFFYWMKFSFVPREQFLLTTIQL